SSGKLFMRDEVQASFSTIDIIRNFRKDNLNNNCKEIEHKILKQQVYSKCIALRQKLVVLAFKFNLTYIVATLRTNSRRRHAKRIKLFTEICAPSSKTINTKT
ncbi:5197_t:CDS:2, partial [Gigaspora margarita]